uniref:hypothetical protein n=1 Tax=Hormidiella parvula TaxID=2058785 RepID=UPI00286C6DA4|nr:hypothetical protein RMD52_pgp069 [Hormidiella parvula]WKT05952.1 hypothetical protein [Hormidiella parvula]
MAWRFNRSCVPVCRIRRKVAVIEHSVRDNLREELRDAQNETYWLYPSDKSYLSYEVSQMQRRGVLLLGVATRVLVNSRVARLARALLVGDMPSRGIDLWCFNRLGVASLQQAFRQARYALGLFQFGIVALSAVWLSYCAWCLVVLSLVFPSIRPLPYTQGAIKPNDARSSSTSRVCYHSAGLKLGHLYNRLGRATHPSGWGIATRVSKQGLIADTPMLHIGLLSGIGKWVDKPSIPFLRTVHLTQHRPDLLGLSLRKANQGTTIGSHPIDTPFHDKLWLIPSSKRAVVRPHASPIRAGSESRRMICLLRLLNQSSTQAEHRLTRSAWVNGQPIESRMLRRLMSSSPEFGATLNTWAIRIQRHINRALGVTHKAALGSRNQEPNDLRLLRVSTALARRWNTGPAGLAAVPTQNHVHLSIYKSAMARYVQPPCSVQELERWSQVTGDSTDLIFNPSARRQRGALEHTTWHALECYDLWLNPFQAHPWKQHAGGVRHTSMLNALFYLPVPARSVSAVIRSSWPIATRLGTHMPSRAPILSTALRAKPLQLCSVAKNTESIRLDTLNTLLSLWPARWLEQYGATYATRDGVLSYLPTDELSSRATELYLRPALVKHKALGRRSVQ